LAWRSDRFLSRRLREGSVGRFRLMVLHVAGRSGDAGHPGFFLGDPTLRTMRCLLLAAGVVGVFGPSFGQGTKPPGGRGTGSSMLIQNEAVQKELKLTDEQRRQVTDIPNRVKAKLKPEFDKMVKLEAEARREKNRELRQMYAAEFPKALAEILTPAQQKRLKQLWLQYSSTMAFSEPEVEKALGLTPDQKPQIKAVQEFIHKETLAIFHTGDAESDATRKKVVALRREALAKATAVLSDDQRTIWKELTGEPFDFPPEKALVQAPGAPDVKPLDPRPPAVGTDTARRDAAWVDRRAT